MKPESSPYGYKVNYDIRNKWHKGHKRKDFEVTTGIVHGTGGGVVFDDFLTFVIGGGYIGNGVYRKDLYKKGVALVNYVIDRDGVIFDVINPHNFVFASGTGGSSKSGTGFDRCAIQIELLNKNADNSDNYTVQQYNSLGWLLNFLKYTFKNFENVHGHGNICKEITGKKKKGVPCPGKLFDFDLLEKVLNITGQKTMTTSRESFKML